MSALRKVRRRGKAPSKRAMARGRTRRIAALVNALVVPPIVVDMERVRGYLAQGELHWWGQMVFDCNRAAEYFDAGWKAAEQAVKAGPP